MGAYDHCLADLKSKFGEKILLSPKDIAPIIDKTVGVQANMRHFKTFPLPVREIGRNVFISIYHLAEWQATGKCEDAENDEQVTEASSAPVKAERKRPEKKKREFDDCLGFYTDWRNSINFQLELLAEIEKLELSRSIPEAPNNEKRPLPTKNRI